MPPHNNEEKEKLPPLKLSYGRVENTSLPEGFAPPAPVVLKEFNFATLNYAENISIFTTIPPQPPGDTDSDPFGWTECFFNGAIKRQIYQSRNFGRFSPATPPRVSHRIGPSPVTCGGLGMFAKHAMKIGDLILSERPLLIAHVAFPAPDNIPAHFTVEQIKQVSLAEREKLLRISVDRMTPSRRAAYLALANSHTEDGSGVLTGIMRTNGFGLDDSVFKTNPVNPDDESRISDHGCSAICDEMSRINHSCSPNVFHVWDTASFSYRLTAARDIAAGEELFTSYCDLLASATERQQVLEPYGFSCKCAACSSNTSRSDVFRTTLVKRVQVIQSLAKTAKDPASHLRILKAALSLLDEVTREGLQSITWYNSLLVVIGQTYQILGDDRNSSKYMKMSGTCLAASHILRRTASNFMELDGTVIEGLPWPSSLTP